MAKQTWNVDVAHSSVDFVIKHMVIAKVKGSFKDFSASIEADVDDLTSADIKFEVDVASVDTRNADRDKHLRSGDFFEPETHPKMTFTSTKVEKQSTGEYAVTGDMTIRGVTRPETFVVTYEGQGKNPYGQIVAGFSVNGTISRSEYGLTWNVALETGGVLIGDQVQISVEIEANPA